MSGEVTYNGTPAKFGVVTFQPGDNQGRPCVTSIHDGRYTAFALKSQKGLAPGTYQVTVVYSQRPLIENPKGIGIPAQVAERYVKGETSGLMLKVPEGGSAITYDIELHD